VNPETCPSCHQHLPADAPAGLCPACVMRAAFAASPAIQGPSIGDLQVGFPQLEILECIGRGGMGIVYKARQLHLDRLVALKILLPGLQDDPGFAERFTREARTLAKLTHPNLVAVHDFGESEGLYYLLMEYVDGVNLRQAMRASRFTPEQALSLIPDLCSALQFAHDHGVLHRDIKPENILLDTRGRVKIADFGIARLVGDETQDITLTMTGAALGSTAYIAPEQIENPEDVDHRADIYSLGVVFYEMLTGGLPLGRFPAPSEKSGSDPRLDEVVFRALEKERERRYQSATDVREGVENHRSGQGSSQASGSLKSTAVAFANSDKVAVWSIGLVIGGLVAGFIGLRTSPVLFGLGATGLIMGLIGCGWSMLKIKRGQLHDSYSTVLMWVFFWPVSIAVTAWGCFGWGSWVMDEAIRFNYRHQTHYPIAILFFLLTYFAPVMIHNLLKALLPVQLLKTASSRIAAVGSLASLLALLGLVIFVTRQVELTPNIDPRTDRLVIHPLWVVAFMLSPIPVILSFFSSRSSTWIISWIGLIVALLSMFDFG
jgi:predicted Ser/Thr protein kinase